MKKAIAKVQQKIESRKLRRSAVELSMSFFDSIHQINEIHWRTLAMESENVYLTIPYLKALEEVQENFDFRYVIYYQNKTAVGITYVQLPKIDIAHSFEAGDSKRKRVGSKMFSKVSVRLMVCGNLFSSGENGYYFTNSLDESLAIRSLSTALYRVRRSEKINGQVSMVMLKDIWPDSVDGLNELKKYDYRKFEIEPNLVMDIRPDWKTFDDYLASITSNYRSKYKKVIKKSKELEIKELSSQDVSRELERIRELFDAVFDKSDFKVGHFDANGFVKLKTALKSKFIIKGFYLEDQLVGFYSAIKNGKMLDANYVGIDYSVNRDKALYNSMLYDLAKLAIEKRVERLCFGRTASEIKSSIGAIPVDMSIYLRHRNSISNKMMKPFVVKIQPAPFEVRSPYKK